MKRVALHTLGCKLNFAETSTIGREFVDRGFQIVEADQPSDVFVLNTCSVTQRTDRECRQLIRRAIRRSPSVFVIVVGCYAQLQPGEIARIEGVDLVVGTNGKFRIFDHISDFAKRSVPHVFVSCIDETMEFIPSSSAEVGNRTRSFLKVQDGCDYSCSFCTIPRARGRNRSLPIDGVVRQAEELADLGYREIVLTGVNVGEYGAHLGLSLFDLLRSLDAVARVDRIRISSIEPNLLTREMVDFILGSRKFCSHFHVPLQSGSDAVLKLMRRRYSASQYRSLIEYIKQRDPEAAIGADVIVGFPGETDEVFEESRRFLADLPLTYLHVFTYSERPNTAAIGLQGSVEPRVRSQRSEMLRLLGRRMRREFHATFLGKSIDVLFEEACRGGRSTGLTQNYIRVEAESDRTLANEIHRVAIRALEGDVCVGDRESPPESTLDHRTLPGHRWADSYSHVSSLL